MKSFLIIGLGRFGRHMAKTLVEQGNEVLGIDINEHRVNDSMQYVPDVQIGNATNEGFIASLGVGNFDVCVVAIGDNFQSSLETTALLQEYGAKFILARANRDVHKKFLLRNGANEVVYAEREMAERLAVKYGSDKIFEYFQLSDGYAVYEIAVPASWVGKTIVGKAVRQQYNISILATKQNGQMQPLPKPEHVFTADETLMIIAHAKDIAPLIK